LPGNSSLKRDDDERAGILDKKIIPSPVKLMKKFDLRQYVVIPL
jgi:hypothetical protein